MSKKAIITGITGQDGTYLAKLLLEKGYDVTGCIRRASGSNLFRLEQFNLVDRIRIVDFDLLESSNITACIRNEKPDEFYNLAAQSFVKTSFDQPVFTSQVNAIGVTQILEAIRYESPKTKFYQASTSEMFGKVTETPQTEDTPFYPRSPYAVSKLYAHWITKNYRESFNLFACSGILFNHESPLRGNEFVTKKITRELAKIKMGRASTLELGNLSAQRDWGFAGDYVQAMHKMLQQPTAEDYVIATGTTHSVREFVTLAANICGFTLEWQGEGIHEQGIDKNTGKVIVKVNPAYFRPAEVDYLIGNSDKARKQLKWDTHITFEKLVTMMMEYDLEKWSHAQPNDSSRLIA